MEVEQLPYCLLRVAAKENLPSSNTHMAKQTRAQTGPRAPIHAQTRFSTVRISIPTRLVHVVWTAVRNLMPSVPLCHRGRRVATKLRVAFMPALHLSGTVPTQVRRTGRHPKVKVQQRLSVLFRGTVRELHGYVISSTVTGLALVDRVQSWSLATAHKTRRRWTWSRRHRDTAGIRPALIPPGRCEDTRLDRMKNRTRLTTLWVLLPRLHVGNKVLFPL